MAVDACAAVLLDLLAQVNKFCAEQGEADFETGAAEAMKLRIVGGKPPEGLQRQLDKLLDADGVKTGAAPDRFAAAIPSERVTLQVGGTAGRKRLCRDCADFAQDGICPNDGKPCSTSGVKEVPDAG